MTTTAEIMEDVERTRANIRATIDEIENRVSVDQLVHRFIAPAKAGTIEFGHLFSDAVRANPLALGVTAVGLGWLMLGPQKPIMAVTDRRRVGEGNRRMEPNRIDEASGAYGDWPVDVPADDPASINKRGGTFRPRAQAPDPEAATGERASSAANRARDVAQGMTERASGTVREASERASSMARQAAERASQLAREASERAHQASATVRDSATSALQGTRERAAVVGSRMRDVASRTSDFAREKPIVAGVILIIGGAALAVLLARRATHHADGDYDTAPAGAGGDYDTAPAGMPETPYASGNQAVDDLPRNPTVALTPEDEEPVYAAGNVSAEAGRQSPGGNGGTGEVDRAAVPAGRSGEAAQSGERAVPEPSDPLDVGKEWPALVARRTGENAVDRQDR